MEVFQDLKISNISESPEEFISQLENKSSGGWVRNKDKEIKMEKQLGPRHKLFFFTLEDDEEFSPVSLWLAVESSSELSLCNIVSDKKMSLSYSEYNKLLQNFCTNVIERAKSDTGIKVVLTKSEVTINDLIPEQVAEKLLQFSRAANKSTGSAHPLDKKRWLDFLVAAHKNHCNLSDTNLRRLLCEEEGWTEDIAIELMSEYSFSQELLRFYDRDRT